MREESSSEENPLDSLHKVKCKCTFFGFQALNHSLKKIEESITQSCQSAIKCTSQTDRASFSAFFRSSIETNLLKHGIKKYFLQDHPSYQSEI